jgi:hypothetical protein
VLAIYKESLSGMCGGHDGSLDFILLAMVNQHLPGINVAHVHDISFARGINEEKKGPEIRLGPHSTSLNATLVGGRVVAVRETYNKQTIVQY